MISATLVICQLANTYLFGTFAYNFGKLYVLLDEYMLQTNGSTLVDGNKTIYYIYEGINQERINQIDFLCPALSLMLSISQACMIHVTLSEAVYTIRFLLAKILSSLLVFNKAGRLPIEEYFGCEFYNDDDIVKPSCAGTIHDQVVSPFTLNLMIGIHIIPLIVFIFLYIKNLTNNEMEHLFLYIESVDGDGRPSSPIEIPPGQNRLLKHSLNDILTDFEIKFLPKM
uniref:Uncharacterized protein n=1 Tax=Panagrolaimus sp. ES5 TaxID=591445 RepID=A0AC34G6N3_9BILA